MDKWEYLLVVMRWDSTSKKWVFTNGLRGVVANGIQDYLNACGTQGWELVDIFPVRQVAQESGYMGNVTEWVASEYQAFLKKKLP